MSRLIAPTVPRRTRLLAIAVAALLALVTILVGQTAGATSSTFTPVADSYVDSSNPTANFGTSTQIRYDASPVVHSYIRFDPEGLSGTVTKATLQIWANSSQGTGHDVFPVADTSWGETTINWNNAPAFGATKIGSSGPVT